MTDITLYTQWMEAFDGTGIKPISDETVAKILAIVYVYGGSMELVFNKKLMADVEYCKKRCNISGGEAPDPKMVGLVKKYISQLEDELKAAPQDHTKESPFAIVHPEWVCTLMKDRYGITAMSI